MLNPLMMKLANLFGSASGPDGNFGANNPPTMDGPGTGGFGGNMSPTSPDIGVGVPNAGNDPQTGMDMSQVLAQLFRPNDEQFNKLAALQPPNRADYKPGKARKISAFMAGMGGNRPSGISSGAVLGFENNPSEDIKNTKAVLDDPFNEAVEDYNRKLKPLETTAELENRRNVNDRQIGSQILRDEEFQRKQAETERQNREMDKIRQQRADAYDFKSRNPAFKTATDDNGELVFYNPVDPTKVYHSGIQTGKLNDTDKINLEHEGRLSEIQARIKGNKEIEGEKNTNRQSLESLKFGNRQTLEQTKEDNTVKNEATRQGNRVALKTTPSGNSSAARPESETQKKQGMINKALKIVSENPELKPYIIFEKNNAGTVQGVSISKTGIFGDEQKRMKAYNLLFGQEPVPGVKQDNSKSQSIRKEIPGHPGKFAVSTDGGKTWKAE